MQSRKGLRSLGLGATRDKFATTRSLGAFALALSASLLSLSRLRLSEYGNAFTSHHTVIRPAPKTSSEDVLLAPSAIYRDVASVPKTTSSGPRPIDPLVGGMYEFRNVCATRNVVAPQLRGIIYLVPDDHEQMGNDLRCAPCSAPLDHAGGWNGTGRDAGEVRHGCGFECVHAMFASSVADWSECVARPSVKQKMKVWGQIQTPSRADVVHYYNESVLLANIQLDNIGHALFDSLLVYLPHWHRFRSRDNDDGFPFRGILADGMGDEGCLDDSDHWFCEILRAMGAFGDGARRLPPPPDDVTLYCYESLYVWHTAQQRRMDHPEWLPKGVFDEFRDVLFEKFDLPRRRDHRHLARDETGSRPARKRLLFYAHEPSGRRVWNGMNDLVARARNRSKYGDVEFRIVRDFGLPIAEQAKLFNGADAHVMVHGAQMANSIFAVDGTYFAEIGCYVPPFLSTPGFLKLIDGKHRRVESCGGDARESDVCLDCEGSDHTYCNFTMKEEAFESLIDQVLREVA